MEAPEYEYGVSCPYCYSKKSEEEKERARARQTQFEEWGVIGGPDKGTDPSNTRLTPTLARRPRIRVICPAIRDWPHGCGTSREVKHDIIDLSSDESDVSSQESTNQRPYSNKRPKTSSSLNTKATKDDIKHHLHTHEAGPSYHNKDDPDSNDSSSFSTYKGPYEPPDDFTHK